MSEHPLAVYCRDKEITQEELAKRLGVSYPTVNHIINGRRKVRPENAIKWENLIGIPRARLRPDIFSA